MKKLPTALGAVLSIPVLTLALLATGSDAPACVDSPPMPGTVNIDLIDVDRALIKFENYTTFDSQPGQFCSCALKDLPSV